jgi:hypothetical protein
MDLYNLGRNFGGLGRTQYWSSSIDLIPHARRDLEGTSARGLVQTKVAGCGETTIGGSKMRSEHLGALVQTHHLREDASLLETAL